MRDRLKSRGGTGRRPGPVVSALVSTLLCVAPSSWGGDEATAAAFSISIPLGTTSRSGSGLTSPTCRSPCESACLMSRRGRHNDDDDQRMPMPQKQSDSDTASADVPSFSSRRRKRRQHPSRQKKLDDNQRIKRQRQRSSRSGDIPVPSGGSSSSSSSGSLFISKDFGDDDADDSGTWEIDDLDSALDSALEVDEDFESSIDSFLDGEYSQPFADEAPAPHPGLTPSDTVECALRSLREMDEPFVFMRFCAPLSRGERWGVLNEVDPWKIVLR